MKIEILGTGCPKCRSLQKNAELAVQELGLDAQIVKVEELDKIIEYGVMATPGIVIDGDVKSYGELCSVEQIKGWLQ